MEVHLPIPELVILRTFIKEHKDLEVNNPLLLESALELLHKAKEEPT